MEYLSPNSPKAFVDFPPLVPAPEGLRLCPLCKGHRGWNLRLNAFRLPAGYENTTENRHRYVHFRSSCDNCNGWGTVPEEQGDHIHEWKFAQNLGRCYNRYVCTGCGKSWNIDSSD